MPSEQTLVEQKVFSFPFSSPPFLDFLKLISPSLGEFNIQKMARLVNKEISAFGGSDLESGPGSNLQKSLIEAVGVL